MSSHPTSKPKLPEMNHESTYQHAASAGELCLLCGQKLRKKRYGARTTAQFPRQVSICPRALRLVA